MNNESFGTYQEANDQTEKPPKVQEQEMIK